MDAPNMELAQVSRILLRRWWIALTPVIVVGIMVIPQWLRERSTQGGFTVTVRYSAAQVASNLTPRDGDYQDVWLASEYTVNALTDWVRSGSFRDEITKQLEANNIHALDLATLNLAADNKRSVGILYLTYPDQAGLENITQAALKVLENRTQDYFPQLGNQAAAVTILDTPAVVAAPPALADRFSPLIKLGIGLSAGVLLAFLAEYLDPFVHRRDQLEDMGLVVVASIPRK
jgi:capsular polysaccharide biosynthesis protein